MGGSCRRVTIAPPNQFYLEFHGCSGIFFSMVNDLSQELELFLHSLKELLEPEDLTLHAGAEGELKLKGQKEL